MYLRELADYYREEGLAEELASARVCQDIVLKAIADGPLSNNVTIKGGVVMRSITGDNRRSTRDIDLDFIHYSLNDDSIRQFVKKLNCIEGLSIDIEGGIKELKHQDYNGKSIGIIIKDEQGITIRSKMDLGVHKHMEIEQEEYCFDVCIDDEGATLLKNTKEQSFVEKLRSLLIFGPNSRRYRDIFDLYYLKDVVDQEKLREVLDVLILKDNGIRESSMEDIIKRVTGTFKDRQYLRRVSDSRQRWIDDDMQIIADGIVDFLRRL